MAWRVKSAAALLATHMGADSVPRSFTSELTPYQWLWEKQQKTVQLLGTLHLCGRTDQSPGFTLAQPWQLQQYRE